MFLYDKIPRIAEVLPGPAAGRGRRRWAMSSIPSPVSGRPPSRERATDWALALPVGAAVGALLSYLLDRDRGHGRRRKLADQAAARLRRQQRRALAQVRYRRGRLRGGMLHLVGAGIAEPVDDVDVKQQIHRALRAAGISPHEINVEVSKGTAVLRGQAADHDQIERIEGLVGRLPGVQEFRNLLHVPGEPAPNKLDALRVSQPVG